MTRNESIHNLLKPTLDFPFILFVARMVDAEAFQEMGTPSLVAALTVGTGVSMGFLAPQVSIAFSLPELEQIRLVSFLSLSSLPVPLSPGS